MRFLRVYQFPNKIWSRLATVLMFGMGKALVVTNGLQKVQMGSLTVVYSTESDVCLVPFLSTKNPKPNTKEMICSGFFLRKQAAFQEPCSFGFSRQCSACSADLQMQVTQPTAVSPASLWQRRPWLPRLNDVCLIMDLTVQEHLSMSSNWLHED